MKRNIISTLIALALFGFSATAQKVAVETNGKPGWQKIAETTADLKLDRDEVMVLGKDHYKAIKLKVTDVEVEMVDLSVYYDNDTKQDIPVRSLIRAGGETDQKDLEGKDMAIKKIVLTYKTVPNAEKDKSHIEIWGLK